MENIKDNSSRSHDNDRESNKVFGKKQRMECKQLLKMRSTSNYRINKSSKSEEGKLKNHTETLRITELVKTI